MTDQALVTQIVSGSKQAFSTFVDEYQNLVLHVIRRLVPNETDRQDVAQEVFVKAYRSIGGFKFQSKLSTWVARIAHNTAINYLEKKKVELYDDISADHQSIEDYAETARSPEQAATINDLASRVRSEIDSLPVIYGTILALYHLEEMSYKDIAEVLQLPEGTVKSYLFRGRKMLRERLSATYSNEELQS